MTALISNDFIQQIVVLLKNARQSVLKTIHHTMVASYFEIGRMIVEEEQKGADRAKYGQKVLEQLSQTLTEQFGRGFSQTNLKQMRQFYLVYSAASIRQTASDQFPHFELSWSHYLKLMRMNDPLERQFYEIESIKNQWSLRELQRQYDSALFTRLALSKDKAGVLALAQYGQQIEQAKDLIKDPYILEFVGLPEQQHYSESDLEQKLIDKLEHFLLELGSGFTFVGRQQRIGFDEKHFYVDLVFYNRLLRCFVLIDLKIGEISHQDLGQMQMYVNYYDRKMKLDDENKTIGVVLCQDKSQAVVEFTLPADNTQIFASKYQTILPSKEDFIHLLSQEEL